MPVISLQNVFKNFDQTSVIQDLSIDFNEGKFICILGSSGSGKTTILRLIAGLEKPDRGKIYLNDILVSESGRIIVPPSHREIGFIFQDLALWPHFTVFENIAFGLKLKKAKNINTSILKTLDFLRISEHQNKYPNQLSGGQQQLAAIARSLVLNPKILLMDEPLANLDVKLKSKIRNQIKMLIEEFSISIIYVTHNHIEAFKLADIIVVLNEGKVMDIGTPEEIQSSEIEYVKEFIEL